MWFEWLQKQRLGSKDPKTICAALKALGERPGPRPVQLILESLFSLRDCPECLLAAHEALVCQARANPKWLLDELWTMSDPRVWILTGEKSTETRYFTEALIAAEVPPEAFRKLVFDTERRTAIRVEVAWALRTKSNSPTLAPLFRELLMLQDRDVNIEAVLGLGAHGDSSDISLLSDKMRFGRMTPVRRAAAQTLSASSWSPLPPEAELAVISGNERARTLACGAEAIPYLLRELNLRSDEDIPEALEQLEAILQADGENIPSALLQTLTSLKNPEYESREFGVGHQDSGYGPADASPVRELARKILTRRG
jgi:hypothetical protein